MAQSVSPVLFEDLVDAVNRFGFQLQSLTTKAEKSSGLCGMNIYQCLLMAAVGSKDENLTAFGNVLGFEISELNQTVRSLTQLGAYSKTCQAVELTSASSVWHKPDFILEKDWQGTMQNTFGATIGPLDVEMINKFIETETKGKIKDIVSESTVYNSVLMLITCIYFKAKWKTVFNMSLTQEATFWMFDNTAQSCLMMRRVGTMEYREDGKAQICILPYKADEPGSSLDDSNSSSIPKWKAAIVLPKERGFSALMDILSTFATSPTALSSQLNVHSRRSDPEDAERKPYSRGMSSKMLDLSLPRFTLKLTLDLIDPLTKLGLDPVFKASSNFEPLSRTGPLLINQVSHDMFIEVNEEGTEMAAVTIVSFGRSRVETVTMRVDRPFLFLVFDEVTGLILCSVAVTSIV
jgi:serine protease inhibitor